MINTPAYWQRIRAHYKQHAAAIEGSAEHWGIDPYAWDHDAGIVMTPIESALWHDIRAEGAVLYPQYPVGRFFVDFASPAACVAIECDGAAFHTDKAKDAARDAELVKAGWTVYRISGSECIKDTIVTENEFGAPVVELSAARLLVRWIADTYSIRVGGRQ